MSEHFSLLGMKELICHLCENDTYLFIYLFIYLFFYLFIYLFIYFPLFLNFFSKNIANSKSGRFPILGFQIK